MLAAAAVAAVAAVVLLGLRSEEAGVLFDGDRSAGIPLQRRLVRLFVAPRALRYYDDGFRPAAVARVVVGGGRGGVA